MDEAFSKKGTAKYETQTAKNLTMKKYLKGNLQKNLKTKTETKPKVSEFAAMP